MRRSEGLVKVRFVPERQKWVAHVKVGGSQSISLHESWAEAIRFGKAKMRWFQAYRTWWMDDPVPRLEMEPLSNFGIPV